MKDQRSKTVCVIGVGNPFRRDDGIGAYVTEEIKRLEIPQCACFAESGEGAALMKRFKDQAFVILVDAVGSKSRPGTIHRFDASREKIPAEFFHYSTHAFSVAEAIEMARVLGDLPAEMIVYGIEGKDFANGTKLSKDVIRSANQVIRKIIKDIESFTCISSIKQKGEYL